MVWRLDFNPGRSVGTAMKPALSARVSIMPSHGTLL